MCCKQRNNLFSTFCSFELLNDYLRVVMMVSLTLPLEEVLRSEVQFALNLTPSLSLVSLKPN